MQPLADSDCMISVEGFSEANGPESHFRDEASESQKRERGFLQAIMLERKGAVRT